MATGCSDDLCRGGLLLGAGHGPPAAANPAQGHTLGVSGAASKRRARRSNGLAAPGVAGGFARNVRRRRALRGSGHGHGLAICVCVRSTAAITGKGAVPCIAALKRRTPRRSGRRRMPRKNRREEESERSQRPVQPLNLNHGESMPEILQYSYFFALRLGKPRGSQ